MCGFACGDPRVVPSVAAPPDLEAEVEGEGGGGSSSTQGSNGWGGRGAAAAPSPQEQQEELAAQALALARRGGEAVLQCMARLAGQQLQQRLPALWQQASAPLAAAQAAAGAAEQQAAVNALQVLAVLAPALHAELVPAVEQLLPLVVRCLQQPSAALKLAAARCLAALAAAHTAPLMPLLLRLLAPLLTGAPQLPPSPATYCLSSSAPCQLPLHSSLPSHTPPLQAEQATTPG